MVDIINEVLYEWSNSISLSGLKRNTTRKQIAKTIINRMKQKVGWYLELGEPLPITRKKQK